MRASLAKSLLTGVFSTALVISATSAMAAEGTSGQVNTALAKKNITEVESLLKSGSGSVDDILKALLKQTQKDMGTDAAFSNKMMTLAGQYAPKVTPPSVPAVCADLRRIVDSLKPEHVGSPLFKSVMDASESFSKAPVVVAAGRPNECEQAWLQLSNLDQEALLAQTPGMRGPNLPRITVKNPIPPTTTPPDTEKPSAD